LPELPEVEAVRRSLAPFLTQTRIADVEVRRPDLRVPFPRRFRARLVNQTVLSLTRRAKYLMAALSSSETLLVHLGMSGSFRVDSESVDRHDHVVMHMSSGAVVIFNDPRRFGLMLLLTPAQLARHPVLSRLGPEPLSPDFDAAALARACRGRKTALKVALLDQRVVAGIGNIYASEALFRSGINPKMPAQRIGRARYDLLAEKIRETLEAAIRAGGSTLRDFVGGDGRAGYFQDEHLVYGRGGEPCTRCGGRVKELRQGQRSTFYCPSCQRR